MRHRSSLATLWLGAALVAGCTGHASRAPDDDKGAGGAGNMQGEGGSGMPGAGGAGGEWPPGMGGASTTAPPSRSAVPACTGEEVPAPRRLRLLTRHEYASTVADLLYIQPPETDNFPVESVVDGFDNNVNAAVVTSRHLDEYLATGERLAMQALNTSRGRLVTCQGAPGCDRTFVTSFGLRAFRRPLTEAEITRHLALFAPAVTGGMFDKGVELTIRAMLASPSFLYRSEVGERAGAGYKLSSYEMASALSYALWGTMPDDALLTAARTGVLDRPDGLEIQANRLLMDPRSRPAIAGFFRQWLGTGGFLYSNKDAAIYPSFTDAVRRAMIDEQDAFVNNVVFNGTGAFAELWKAEYVFASAPLATFYGLTGAAAAAPTRIPAPGGATRTRGGLLTLGAVLGAHAHPNESSPIRRGLFVRARLLCETLPNPPENLNIMPPGLDPSLTTRARFARHDSDPSCQICHKLIDPVGFGFERYDGVGQHRPTENGMPVDASGQVRGLESLDDADAVVAFDGPVHLGAILADSPNAQACIARQLFRYTRGGENEADACAIKALQTAFTRNGLNLQRLLRDVITQKSFLTRN